MKRMNNLNMQIRLTLYGPKGFPEGTFGKGVAVLLRGVDSLGSLNASAKSIHMAYSKAWRIVKEAEQGMNFQLIDRMGARGSTLTPEGRKLLEIYERLEKEAENELGQRFAKLLDA
ncbi:MAG: LysR family transcriptional regulator [Actinomycetia bacterium]|nr:LysR family transcriptional regulator [Actinomycetes bacterium]